MTTETCLFLCGDVMTGRAIDQIMPHSVDPALHERRMKSATGYVSLAEKVNGPISCPVSFDYIWGDAMKELHNRQPDARIINLETAVTLSDDWTPKGINYRMHPGNLPCLSSVQIDCCVLANNHVLDWGESGLRETLQNLRQVTLVAGAGETANLASAPAIIHVPGRRVLVFSASIGSSGVPLDWAATDTRPGVSRLDNLSANSIEQIIKNVAKFRKPEDIVVFSIHWGPNWGYRIPLAHRRFARRLIDSGQVDIIHGHSSHHPQGLEVYRGKLILYGCGDFINDYEGIPFKKKYRSDLCLMYFPVLGDNGQLVQCAMVPMKIHRLSVQYASTEEAAWLSKRLTKKSPKFNIRLGSNSDGSIDLRW
ncbi:MAG: CapA family protein [Gammaproteobacteria bacterium]|nr:CapA family protein [Gammaproteobacteria bacterium]